MSPEEPQLKPWYDKGLRFECQRCGACCTSHDAYAFVYLVEEEARAIALALGIPWPDFEARHLVREDGWLRLATSGPRCPFLTENGSCRVYPVRPMQCRTWPFWKENLVPGTWEREVRSICPGIGKGRLHSAAEIDATAAANEEWYER